MKWDCITGQQPAHISPKSLKQLHVAGSITRLSLSSTSVRARKRTKALKHTCEKAALLHQMHSADLVPRTTSLFRRSAVRSQRVSNSTTYCFPLLLAYCLKWKHAKTNIVHIYCFSNSIICKSSVPSIKNYHDIIFSQGNIKIYFILDLFQIWFKLQLSKQYNAKGNCNRKCA